MLFQDESTFYQSGIPTRRWAPKGSKPELPIYGTYSKKNVFGFINAINGDSHFQYIDRLNSDCFIQYLNAIMKVYAHSRMIYIVIDNAPGHRSKKVDNFVSMYSNKIKLIKLPPYSPDLNPIETIWREVKKDVVYNTFYPLVQDFHVALTQRLKNFEHNRIINICNINKYKVQSTV